MKLGESLLANLFQWRSWRRMAVLCLEVDLSDDVRGTQQLRDSGTLPTQEHARGL